MAAIIERCASRATLARSRTEPANRVERAGIILAYLNEPSAYAVARTMGVSQQTVTRCLERAAEFGVLAALDDRARTGREATITAEARTWLVGLACAKPKQFGYPHELWTARLLAAHARDHGPGAGHPSLAHLAQGTVCKILAAHDVKPHKVRYYLERRDPEFEPKMAEVLCVYREVATRRAAGGAGEAAIAVVPSSGAPGEAGAPEVGSGCARESRLLPAQKSAKLRAGPLWQEPQADK